MESSRKREILEVALSYLLSNLDDAGDVFADQAEDVEGQWFVQARYISPVEEQEVREILDQFVYADEQAARSKQLTLIGNVVELTEGDHIRFRCEMSVGHEGTIPEGATGTYRGISDDLERYLLFEMDGDYGFLEEHYGYPNCFLGDQLCLDEDHGEIEKLD